MMLRRHMLMPSLTAVVSEPLGEFTKGYVKSLQPSSESSFIINHNLGVIPKVIIINLVDGTQSLSKYGVDATIWFDGTVDKSNNTVGVMAYNYYYNSKKNSAARALPNTNYVIATTTTITVAPLYNSTRSPWDTNATYVVQVYA